MGEKFDACPLCDVVLNEQERAGQFHHPHWNSLTLLPGLTVTESRIAQKIEGAARAIAAQKCGTKDPRGYRLPDDIWKQGIPAAVAMLKMDEISEDWRQQILRAAEALEARPPHPDSFLARDASARGEATP
jgi:hypothetical protein